MSTEVNDAPCRGNSPRLAFHHSAVPAAMSSPCSPHPEAQDDGPDDSPAPSPMLETRAPAIDAATRPGDEDEFEIDEEPFGDDGITSVTSSVYACTYERGRRYHCFKNARYPIPNDDMEKDREDLKHAMLMELTDGALFYSPVKNPQHIIDCGTGTGKAVSAHQLMHGVMTLG